MNYGNIITQYYAGMTTILKFFILYILSKWYGIFFGFPFLYLYFRIYKIIINKKYNLLSLSLKDQYLILKSIFSGKINIKEINLDKNSQKEDIIKIIKEFINNNYIFKRILIYKWYNYYWRQLNEKEIEKNIKINIDNNIDNELNKKFNLIKEPFYKLFLIKNENDYKIIIKYNFIMNEKYVNLLNNYINEKNIKGSKKQKHNKFIALFMDFITYPIQLIFELLIIIFLSNKNI